MSSVAPAARGETGMPFFTLSLMGVAVCAAITTEVLPVGLLPQIGAALGTSVSRAGWLVTAYAAVVVVGSIPLTAFVARWPRRRVLVSLLVVYAASNLVFVATRSFAVALAARLLGGLAHAGFFSLVFAAAVSMVAPYRAGRAMAIVGAGNALALVLGVPLGTAFGAAVGWRLAFLVLAMVMALLALLVAFTLPSSAAPSGSGYVPVLTAARSPALARIAIVIVVFTLGHYTPFTYVSPLLLQAGVASGSISLVLFGYGIGGLLGIVLAGAVVDRHPRRALITDAAFMAACLLLLATGAYATWLAVAAMFLWGAAFGALPTLLQAAALRAAPQAPDAAPAVVNTTFNVGIAGGAILGGKELLLSPPLALPLTGAFLAIVALCLIADMKPRTTEPARHRLE